MKAWKGVVFMWSTVILIALAEFVAAYPKDILTFLSKNPQIIGLIATTPIMIWLIWWMMKQMGGMGSAKKPDHWWTEEKDDF